MRSYFFLGELLIILKKRFLNSKRPIKKPLIVCLGLGLLLAWAFMALERSIIPTLIAISESRVAAIANEAIIDAVNGHIDTLLSGKKLLDFHVGDGGQLLYVQTNTANLNEIQAESLSVLQEAIADLKGFHIYVPLGQAFGSSIFASVGPNVKVTLFPYGYVNVKVLDSFEVTGINQIKYDITLRVTYTIQVVIPLISSRTQVSTDIPLATVLIPGKVPDTYLTIPYPTP